MAPPLYLSIDEQQRESLVEINLVARGYDLSGAQPRDESVGQVCIAVTPNGVAIEVQRIDESATGPVEVTVR